MSVTTSSVTPSNKAALLHAAMATKNQSGASLQAYNSELVECLRDLREKRDAINKAIIAEEKRKADIESKLQKLGEQVGSLL
jgi:hypothetical protein